MDERSKVFAELADVLLTDEKGDIYKATKYLSPTLTIKATRKRYKGKVLKGKAIDIVFTVGKPNYEEREFIKRRKIIKEPFPVKAIMIKTVSATRK